LDTQDTRTEIEILADNFDKLRGSILTCPIALDEDGERFSDADGITQLDKGTTAEACCNKGLGDPTCRIRRGTIDLGVILHHQPPSPQKKRSIKSTNSGEGFCKSRTKVAYLAGESTTSMSTPPTIRINNDLPSCNARIALWSADYKPPTWLDMVDGPLIQKVLGDDLVDDLLLYFLAEGLGGDFGSMLS
jgi:hypothetical protein